MPSAYGKSTFCAPDELHAQARCKVQTAENVARYVAHVAQLRFKLALVLQMHSPDDVGTEDDVLHDRCVYVQNLADRLLTHSSGESLLKALDVSTIEDWNMFAAKQLCEAPEFAAFWKAQESLSKSTQLLSSLSTSGDTLDAKDNARMRASSDSEASSAVAASSFDDEDDDRSADDVTSSLGDAAQGAQESADVVQEWLEGSPKKRLRGKVSERAESIVRAVQNFIDSHDGAFPTEGKKRPLAEQKLGQQLRKLRTSPTTTEQELILIRSLGVDKIRPLGSVDINKIDGKARARFRFKRSDDAPATKSVSVYGPWRTAITAAQRDRESIAVALRDASTACEDRLAAAKAIVRQLAESSGRMRKRGPCWQARFQLSSSDITGPSRRERDEAAADRLIIGSAIEQAKASGDDVIASASFAAQRLRDVAEAHRASVVEAMKQARLDVADAERALEKTVSKIRPWSRMYKHPYLGAAGIRIRINRYTNQLRYEHVALGKLTEARRPCAKRDGQEPCLVFEDLDLVVVIGPYALGSAGERQCFLKALEQRSSEDAEASAVLVQSVLSMTCGSRALQAQMVEANQNLRRAWESFQHADPHKPLLVNLMRRILSLSVDLIVLAEMPHDLVTEVAVPRSVGHLDCEMSGSDQDDDVASDTDVHPSPPEQSTALFTRPCKDPNCNSCNALYAAERDELRKLCPVWHRHLHTSILWRLVPGAQDASQAHRRLTAAIAERSQVRPMN